VCYGRGMQVVYHAKDLVDAETARDVLVGAGIPTHIADQVLSDAIRVLVDNRCVDQARRAIAAWRSGKPLPRKN
jgi:Putative prokaryotic signal transducing protein